MGEEMRAFAILLLFISSAHADGAIVTGLDSGGYADGVIVVQSSAPETVGIQLCQKKRLSKCVVRSVFKDQCAAIASPGGRNIWAWGTGATPEEARSSAVKACNTHPWVGCIAIASACDGTQASLPQPPLPQDRWEQEKYVVFFIVGLVGLAAFVIFLRWLGIDLRAADASSASSSPPKLEEQIPEPPAMPPPTEGSPAVGIRQHGEFVYIWIKLTETDLQRLQDALDEPVDQYPVNREKEKERIEQHYLQRMDEAKRRSPVERGMQQEMARQDREHMLHNMGKPRHITLRDMLAYPFRYRPIGHDETHAQYLDRLRKKVFPKIKEMAQAAGSPKEEGFTL